MFDKLRARIKTRQEYMDSPVTFEVLGVQGDERDVDWFRKHFGHRSLQAMFWLYVAYGMVIGAVAGIIASGGEVGDAAIVGFTLGGVFLAALLIEKHESKKVT